jgi:hypothetical protein
MVPNSMAKYWDRRIFFEHHPMSGKENQFGDRSCLFEFWDFHCGTAEDSVLLGYNAVSMGNQIPSSSSRVRMSWTLSGSDNSSIQHHTPEQNP